MPIEALVSPLPSELTTPPVTKICLVMKQSLLGIRGSGLGVEKGDWLRATDRFCHEFRVTARCLSPFSTRTGFQAPRWSPGFSLAAAA